jgi:phospholipid/cholesterol/gamma-HCH transport system ATP-binding protein
MKHIVGLMRPDRGDVVVHGMSIPRLSRSELLEARKRFGVLFQDGALFGSLTLFDNVAYPLRLHSDNTEDEIEEMVMARLAEVGLEAARHRLPNELSGGMRKRAGFARALVLEPEILLFDEPDSGLDPVRTALLCELIDEIHEQNGGTYVIVSHDILSARRIARHIAIMWHGRVVEDGPADEVLASDHLFVSQFMAGEATGPLTME